MIRARIVRRGIFLLVASSFCLVPPRSHGQGLLDLIQNKMGDPEQYAGERKTSAVIERKDHNFSLNHPGGDWRGVVADKLHPMASVGFERRGAGGELFCVVMAQALPSQSAGDSALPEMARGIRIGQERTGRIEDERTTFENIGSLRFAHVVTTWRPTITGLRMVHEHWLTTKGGFSWDIIFWSLAEHRVELGAEARRIVATFHILDDKRKSLYFVPSLLADVDRPEHGYRTKLAGGPWGTGNLNDLSPLVNFGASRDGAGLLVMPLHFDDGKVPDLEPLAHGLLASMGFDYPAGGNFDTEKLGADKLEISTNRQLGKATWHYILRVVRGENCAWLVAGWLSMSPQKVNASHLRDAIDAVTLFTPKGVTPPLTKNEKQERGVILNAIGLAYFNAQKPEAGAQWCLEGFQNNGDAVALENAVFMLDKAGRSEEALKLAKKHGDTTSKSPTSAGRIALIRAKAGEGEAATTTLLRLINDGMGDDKVLAEWTSQLLQLGLAKESLQIAEAYVKLHPTATARRWHALTLSNNNRSDDAVSELNKLLADEPDDMLALAALGEILNSAGKYDRASEIADDLLKKNFDPVRSTMILGWSQMGKKWHREAKTTFEKALSLDPERDDIKRAIAIASSAMGQGSNTELKTPLDPVAVPSAVTAAIDAVKPLPEQDVKGQPAVWLHRSVGYFYKTGEPRRSTIRRMVKVLTKEGAEAMSTIEHDFDPLGERVYVNLLEVKSVEGKIISRGDIGNAYVRDLDEGGIASNRKMLHLQVSGVTPGCTVEYEITFENRHADDGFGFEHHPFGSLWPTRSDVVYVAGEPDSVKVHTEHFDVVQTADGKGWKAWIAPAPKLLKFEPLALPFDHYVPMLWLGSVEESWKKAGEKYLGQIADRLKPDPAATELAKKLTADLKSDAEKVSALVRAVQKDITYKAIEFGVRARRPNSPSQTLDHRYGDCKDHALLLQQMLRAAGITAHLTLLNTGWRTVPEMPSLDQFNHMIVHVPSLGESGFLDCTSKYGNVIELPTSGIWRARPFVLDPQNPRLAESPAPPQEAAVLDVRRTITAEGDEDILVDETATLTGYYAAGMRGALAAEEPDRQLQTMQTYLARRASVELRSFDFENLRELDKPAVLHMKYLLRRAVAGAKGQRELSLRVPVEANYLLLGFVKDRTTPFEIELPVRISSETHVALPGTMSDAQVNALAGGGKTPFCEWNMKPSLTAEGRELQLKFQLTAPRGEFPREQYAACQKAWAAALDACEARLAWP